MYGTHEHAFMRLGERENVHAKSVCTCVDCFTVFVAQMIMFS